MLSSTKSRRTIFRACVYQPSGLTYAKTDRSIFLILFLAELDIAVDIALQRPQIGQVLPHPYDGLDQLSVDSASLLTE
jgi:hypothetical protein